MAMIKPLRLLRATLSNIWIPAAIIIANIIKPAPPNTGNGIETINAPNTGNKPAKARSTPVNATTWRLATPVKEITPIFCENEENGVVDIIAAKADPKPSAKTPPRKCLPVISVLVALPRAKKLPLDSTIVTK